MFFLFLSLISSPAHAGSVAIEGPPTAHCAKMSLSAIYGAEKSYQSEYDKFSESFSEIGFEPDLHECKEWRGSIRVFDGGREFLATYTLPGTGETWTINEKKELRQD